MVNSKGIDKEKIKRGNPLRLGVTWLNDKYNFAVSIPEEKPACLLLYQKGESSIIQEIPLPIEERTGTIAAVLLEGFKPKKYEYNYRIGEEIVQDPFAAVIVGRGTFGQMANMDNPHEVRCACISEEFNWEDDICRKSLQSELVLYKLHVRGFTKQRNSKVKEKGTFLGLQKKIPYLKELGITAVELMPAYEFFEILLPKGIPYEHYQKGEIQPRINFWGYTDKAFYYAPKLAYCATDNPVREVKDMVKSFHREGIECIMEFYFSPQADPLSVLETLRYWKSEYHMDGFHLVGDRVPKELIMKDPLLATTKLFFQSVDGYQIYQDKPPYYKHLAEYNDGFLQDVRRFLKGDEDMLNAFTYRARHNPVTHGIVNYLSIQDGFTLADMVSYDVKHNEANGEENRDGTNYNYSWNCGIEGPTRKMAVRFLRRKQLRNSFLFLLLSQGIPLIYAGDEIGNSQQGNNNAYCQDNETGWVDWSAKRRNENLLTFVQKSITFRKEHPVLHMEQEPHIMDYKSYGYPDLSYHSQRAWFASFDNNFRHLGMMYGGEYGKREDGTPDDFIYIAYNMHWIPHEFALPHLPEGKKWYVTIDTGLKEGDGFYPKGEEPIAKKMIKVSQRTIVVLVGK